MAGISETGAINASLGYIDAINFRTKIDKGFRIPKNMQNQYIFDEDHEPEKPKSQQTPSYMRTIGPLHRTSLDPAFNIKSAEERAKSFSKDELRMKKSDIQDYLKYRNGELSNPAFMNEFKSAKEYDDFMSEFVDSHLTLDLDPSVMNKNFSEREKVSNEDLEKAKEDGVVQKKPNGSWGIISIDAKEWWTPDYETKEKAQNALAAYHANKFFSTFDPNPTDTVTADVPHLIGSVMFSVTYTHLFHLSTQDYPSHIALQEYYEEMPKLIDKFAEAWLGDSNDITFQNTLVPNPEDPIGYLEALRALVLNVQSELGDELKDYQALLDPITAQIDSTLYKLKRLSSGKKVFSIAKDKSFSKLPNPGFKKGDKALRVMFRYNPQLGEYASLSVSEVIKLTSGSAIINAYGASEEKYDFYGDRRDNTRSLYGSSTYKLYPKDVAIDMLKEFANEGKFNGFRVSCTRGEEKEYAERLINQLK